MLLRSTMESTTPLTDRQRSPTNIQQCLRALAEEQTFLRAPDLFPAERVLRIPRPADRALRDLHPAELALRILCPAEQALRDLHPAELDLRVRHPGQVPDGSFQMCVQTFMESVQRSTIFSPGCVPRRMPERSLP